EHSGCLRGGRPAPPLDEAHRLGHRRGRDGDSLRPPVPEHALVRNAPMHVPTDIRKRIREIPALADLTDDAMERLLADATTRRLEPGEVLIVEGEIATAAYLIIEGEVEILRATGDGEVVVASRGTGELVGEMGLLMEARRNATVRAGTEALVLEISAAAFDTILRARPEMAVALVRTVWNRLQAAEAHLVQHQKMAALGTLAAGLAH